jgi:hypothetical protein
MPFFASRPRLQTEETLQARNGNALHVLQHMTEANPFLGDDPSTTESLVLLNEGEGDDSSTVSTVSMDSYERYKNWSQGPPPIYDSPSLPPVEIRIRVKITSADDAVPDWLQGEESQCTPRMAGFMHPLLADLKKSGKTPHQQEQAHLRNVSWNTETTMNSTLQQVYSAPEEHVPPPPLTTDRPRRRHQRGSSQAFSIGSFVGQSSLNSAPGTTNSSSASHSFEVESFSYARRANRKLDTLVADTGKIPHRMNLLQGEVLFMLDKVASPVKKLVKHHHKRSKSYDLHASKHGCLA